MAAAQLVLAQRGADWMNAGFDPQRSQWLRGDGKISLVSMSRPGFKLLWTHKAESTSAPVLIDFYIGYKGFRTLGFYSGPGGITAVDTDLSRLEWDKRMPAAAGTAACPGGMTAGLARPTSAGYPGAFTPRGFGRSAFAKSGVGEPHQGAVTIRPPTPQGPPQQAAQRRGRPTAAPFNPFERRPQYVHSVDANGRFHSMYLSNGDEPNPAIDFVPKGANAQGLMVLTGIAFVATVNGCNGVGDGLWSLDIESKQVKHWSGPGTIGFASGPEGLLYASAGDRLTAVDHSSMQEKASLATGLLASAPLVLEHNEMDWIAVTTKDGRLLVADGGLKAVAAQTRASGNLASWLDAAGQRWILTGGTDGVNAYKLLDDAGALKLEKAWSAPIGDSLTPIVVNGVVFAVSQGASPALHALDGLSGQTLWTSGGAIRSPVRGGAISSGGGRVYVGAADGTQYAFGFHLEI
jgi:hypothetical protein